MSAISSFFQTNSLLAPSQNSTPASISWDKSKNSNYSKLYLGPGQTNVPGVTNIFYAPYEFVRSNKAILKAVKIDDQEGLVENGLRIASTPFSFFNSVSQLVYYACKAGVYFNVLAETLNPTLISLSTYIIGVGLVMCAFEGVLETLGLIRAAKLHLKHYPSDLESFRKTLSIQDPIQRKQKISELLERFLQRSPLSIEVKNEIEAFLRKNDLSNDEFFNQLTNVFNQIEENIYLTKLSQFRQAYFQISPEELEKIETEIQKKGAEAQREKIIHANLKRKSNDLIRRVQPWLANKIEQTLPGIIQDLQSDDALKRQEAKGKAAEIFDNIKMQSQKKLLIHGVGLAAVLITAVGLILSLSCFALPFLIPFIVVSGGGILAIARYFLNRGLINSTGWEFNGENCIPKFIQAMAKKTPSVEKKAPEPISTILYFDPLDRENRVPRKKEKRNRVVREELDFTMAIPPWIKI
jgi:hypothetical protein